MKLAGPFRIRLPADEMVEIPDVLDQMGSIPATATVSRLTPSDTATIRSIRG